MFEELAKLPSLKHLSIFDSDRTGEGLLKITSNRKQQLEITLMSCENVSADIIDQLKSMGVICRCFLTRGLLH